MQAGNVTTMKKLLIIVNRPDYFLSHRKQIGLAAREAGYEVHIASVWHPSVGEIERLGFPFHKLSVRRGTLNPLLEFEGLLSILKLIRVLRPDLLHLVTMKPVIYGGLVARILPVRGVVAAVAGLGSIFIGSSLKSRLIRPLVSILYVLALRHQKVHVIFQNSDDQAALERMGALTPGQFSIFNGSGVDTANYIVSPEPDGAVVVALPSRLLRDKGVIEFFEAAKLLKRENLLVRFVLAGDVDEDNPEGLSLSEVEDLCESSGVEYLGFQQDMAAFIRSVHVVVLPSYREGMPKVLLEAAACGRPSVTTDTPGCRDAIVNGKTGLLVPLKDPQALASAIRCLVLDSELRKRMGESARELALEKFDVKEIVKAHLKLYDALSMSSCPGELGV